MSFKKYFLSKLPYLSVNIVLFFLGAVMLKIVQMSSVVLFLIFLIWFMPLITYMLIMFFKEKRFYSDIINVIDNLDKKYLLSEVIRKPNYYEGKIIYDVLKESNRNMHEHVNSYKNFYEEYREYIETWVHEIKTPLSSLKLMIENSNIKEKNNFIDESDKIDRYITQALYYCRSNDVSKDYVVSEFNLKEIVNECIRKNRRDFINKKIKVVINDSDINVVSDCKWIRFIINQIIINSIKYIDSEEGILKIYGNNINNKKSLVIEDNGIGIPKCDINRVFDKGFTGENGRKYGRSTGIGLYLCKKLCGKLQLNIYLESQVSCGTKVIIEFS